MESACVSPCGRFERGAGTASAARLYDTYRAVRLQDNMQVHWVELHVKGLGYEDLRGTMKHLLRARHRHVVSLLTAWVQPGRSELVMITECCGERNMKELLVKRPRQSLGTVKDWALQVLRGLDYLHSVPIVVRELKLENLFVSDSGTELQIGGYQLLKIVECLQLDVLGCPEYLAPEAFDNDYDERADVYSFGICLTEIASCMHPYSECRTFKEKCEKIHANVPPDAVHMIRDAELKEFILACLRDKASRPTAKTLLKSSFFRVSQQDSRPVVLQELQIINEVEDEASSVAPTEYIDEESIEISIIIKLNETPVKYTFPFSMRLDSATKVAEEMVRDLGLNPEHSCCIANVIESKVIEANFAVSPRVYAKIMRRYSDRPTQSGFVQEAHRVQRTYSMENLKPPKLDDVVSDLVINEHCEYYSS